MSFREACRQKGVIQINDQNDELMSKQQVSTPVPLAGLLLGTEEAGEEVSHAVEEASGGRVLAWRRREGQGDGRLRGLGLHWHG